MTKRFTRCKDECKVKVYDEVTQEIIPAMRVVELMNELYEKDRDGEECYRKLLEKYDKLKEENEQLREIIEEGVEVSDVAKLRYQWSEYQDNYYKSCWGHYELHEENIMLKNIKKDKIIKRDYTSMGLYDNKNEKEIEQLKQENRRLKVIKDYVQEKYNDEVHK